MRRFRYPFLALLVVAAAFCGYWWMQGGIGILKPGAQDSVEPTERRATTSASPIAYAERTWSKQYDENQRLVSQFRAGDVQPQGDGSFGVTDLEVIFHMDGDRRVHLAGRRGLIHGEQAAPTKGLNGAMEKPNRGTLFDVTIRFLQSADDPSPLVITMNNAVFDMQSLHVFTDAYVDPKTNEKVPGDRVPVQVRGEEMDFDGQGLQIYWNDRDRRLQLLEIQHGGRAVLKRPGVLGSSPSAKSPAARREGEAPAEPVAQSAIPVAKEVARPEPRPPSQVVATQPAVSTKPTAQPVLYRATFVDNVRGTQGGQPLAIAEQLIVDYATASNGSSQKSTAPSTTKPAAPVPAQSPTILEPSTQATAVAQQPAPVQSPPTTAPRGDEPIVLTWTGPLRVVAIESAPMMPIAPGEAVVRFVGAPAVVSLQGTDARCASLTYHTKSSKSLLVSSPAVPIVTLKDPRGMLVEGESIEYADEVATILGKSRAVVPNQKDGSTFTANWTQSGRFHLVRDEKSADIRSAELKGTVKVQHPRLNLASKELDLAFSSAADRDKLPLQHVSARGDIACRMFDANRNEQNIRAQSLDADMAMDDKGEPYARAFEASGAVEIRDDVKELAFSAGHVKGSMQSPATTQPLARIASLVAKDNVKISWKGSTATGDLMEVKGAGDQQMIELTGTPEASFADASGNWLQGPVIQVYPNTEKLRVPGRGSLRVFQVDGEKKIPIDVSWTGGLAFDSKLNQVVIDEEVIAQSIEDAEHARKASAGQMMLLLADVAPEKADSKSKMARKEIRQITLEQQARVNYAETTPDAKALRTVELRAEKMTFDPITRRFEILMPGQALIDDAKEGPTVMVWKDHFVFEEARNRLEVAGEVWFRHQPKEDAKFDLRSPKVVAELATDEKTSRKVLSKVTLEGPVTVAENDIEQFEAATVEYDPKLKQAIARGSDRMPGRIKEAKGLTSSTFTELLYNVAEKRIEKIDGLDARIRR